MEREGEIAGMRIGEIARRTGTTTSLLRAWETRHGVLVPTRTAGGQRLFSERDVDRVRLVQQLVSQGWSIAGAVARLRDSGDLRSVTAESTGADDLPPQEYSDVPLQPGLLAPLDDVDPDAVRVAFDTTRAMLHATSPAEVRDALVTMVERLGGTVGPAATQDDHVIAVDLSFGEGAPLLPRAAPATVGRMRLEALLPVLVEDGRALVHQLRLAHESVDRSA